MKSWNIERRVTCEINRVNGDIPFLAKDVPPLRIPPSSFEVVNPPSSIGVSGADHTRGGGREAHCIIHP